MKTFRKSFEGDSFALGKKPFGQRSRIDIVSNSLNVDTDSFVAADCDERDTS